MLTKDTSPYCNAPAAPPFLQKWWDATSFSKLTCARRYEYSMIRGFRTEQDQINLVWGSAYDKCKGARDRHIALGGGREQATIEAIREALTIIAESPTLRESTDNRRTSYTLLRAIAWVADAYENDQVCPVTLPDGEPAVQVGFALPMDGEAMPLQFEIWPGEPAILCGWFDGIVELGKNGPLYVSETKTTHSTLNKAYFGRFSPNMQTTTYDAVVRWKWSTLPIRGVLLEATQTAVNFTRVKRERIWRTAGHSRELIASIKDMLTRAKQYAEQGFWPMNEAACFMCPYREVCSASPQRREGILKAKFKQRRWNPRIGVSE